MAKIETRFKVDLSESIIIMHALNMYLRQMAKGITKGETPEDRAFAAQQVEKTERLIRQLGYEPPEITPEES
jgi:hypothetical protein